MNPPRKNLERMLSDCRIGEPASMPEAPPRFTVMAAPSETTTERHVRVCPQHGVEIQETRGGKLVCPKGWHPVGKFRVVDTLKHRVVEATVDGGGIQEMTSTRPGVVVAPPKSSTKNTERMQVAKFVDSEGVVLLLRLVRRRTARSGDVFVVCWTRGPGPDGKSTTGTLHHGAHAEPARTAFAKAVEEAKGEGWMERSIQSHKVNFLPLPKPTRALGIPPRPRSTPDQGRKAGR